MSLQISPLPAITLERRARTKGGRQNLTPLFIAGDLAILCASAIFATFLRFHTTDWNPLRQPNVAKHIGFLVLYAGFLILSSVVYEVHSGKRWRSARLEQIALLKATAMAALLESAVIFLSGEKGISREVVVETVLLSTVFIWSCDSRGREGQSTVWTEGIF